MRLVELHPMRDKRASFYSKAMIKIEDNGRKVLLSYCTPVAEITSDGKAIVYGKWSGTTTRHCKEFLYQEGFKADSIKQMLKDYSNKEVK